MSEGAQEHFPPDDRRTRRLAFAAGCCLAVCAAYALQRFVSGSWQPHATFLTLLFGWIAGYFVHRWWRARTGAILVDEEGLWPEALPREQSLVRWSDLHATDWTRLPGSLRLRGESGKILASISLDLLGFGRFETLLVERTRNHPGNLVHALPTVYYAAFPAIMWLSIALAGIILAVFSTEGWWVSWAILEISLWIAFLIYMDQGPGRLKIEGGKLYLAYALHERVIVRDEVDSMTIGDPRQNEVIQPWQGVVLHRKWGKPPVVIRGLHYEPEDMLLRIEAWLAGDAPEFRAAVSTSPLPAPRR